MRFFDVMCDYETSEHAGAGGMFQVISLNEGDLDVTYLVDQGVHFSTVKQLEGHLAKITGDEVDLSEV